MPFDTRTFKTITSDQGNVVLQGLAIDDDLTAKIAVVKKGCCRMRQVVVSPDLLEVTLTPGEGDDSDCDQEFGDMSGPPDEE